MQEALCGNIDVIAHCCVCDTPQDSKIYSRQLNHSIAKLHDPVTLSINVSPNRQTRALYTKRGGLANIFI